MTSSIPATCGGDKNDFSNCVPLHCCVYCGQILHASRQAVNRLVPLERLQRAQAAAGQLSGQDRAYRGQRTTTRQGTTCRRCRWCDSPPRCGAMGGGCGTLRAAARGRGRAQPPYPGIRFLCATAARSGHKRRPGSVLRPPDRRWFLSAPHRIPLWLCRKAAVGRKGRKLSSATTLRSLGAVPARRVGRPRQQKGRSRFGRPGSAQASCLRRRGCPSPATPRLRTSAAACGR